MEFIDSHAHLDFEEFDTDFIQVLERAEEAGVRKIINIGADVERSRASVILAEKYPNIWATVGVHPDDAKDIDVEYIKEELERMIKSSRKVVGIGECGLDYFRTEDVAEMAAQNSLFKAQLEIAREHHLPVVIHIRNGKDDRAFRDAISIIKGVEYFNGVVHCFTFGSEEAKELLELGFHLGFTGIITYKNSESIKEAVKVTPLERLLIETDCPFLAPQKYRGKRNEPAYVAEVAKTVVDLKNISLEEVASTTTENTQRLFRLK